MIQAFIEYSNNMGDIYKNTEEYNPNKKRKILIVFDDMIADMLSMNNFNSLVTGLFIRCRKLNISVVIITQCYIAVPKNVRLNSSHKFIMKIPSKRQLQQIILQLSRLYEPLQKCNSKPYSFVVIENTLCCRCFRPASHPIFS